MQNKYVKLWKCTNCGAINTPGKRSCHHCGGIFIQEMDFEEWTRQNNELQRKRIKNETDKVL